VDQSEDLQSLYEMTTNKVSECLDALHKELYQLSLYIPVLLLIPWLSVY